MLVTHHQSSSFTLGSGPQNLGLDCMLILVVHFWEKIFFVTVDAHSKWVEAAVVSSPSSQQAMQVLRHIFATHGLSDILVSDNGTAFTCAVPVLCQG